VLSSQALAQSSDPWFAEDKAKHFAASGLIAASGYSIGALSFDARYKALLLGGGLALSAGIAKETYDLAGYGNPSWRDLTWDVIGTAVGLGLAWGVDLAVRGTNDKHPALGMSASQKAGLVGFSF
jgi:putative lipoprotein